MALTTFWRSAIDISVQQAQKRTVSARTGRQSHIMQTSIRSTYEMYKAETGKKIGKTKFASLRPPHVKPHTKAKYNQCLCIYCVNIEQKLNVLNAKLVQFGRPEERITDKYQLVDKTLCSPLMQCRDKLQCTDRTCCNCSEIDLQQMFTLEELSWSGQWRCWELAPVRLDEMVKKMLPQLKQGTADDLLKEMEQELVPLASHLFTAVWQGKKFW